MRTPQQSSQGLASTSGRSAFSSTAPKLAARRDPRASSAGTVYASLAATKGQLPPTVQRSLQDELKAEVARQQLQIFSRVTANTYGEPSAPTLPAPCRKEEQSSLSWKAQSHHLSKQALWSRIQEEARRDAELEPDMAAYYHQTILAHGTLESAFSLLLATKLASPTLQAKPLNRTFQLAYEDDPSILEASLADMQAVFDRDPACDSYSHCMLHFKGYHATQCHRVAHWLWGRKRKALALALQSRVSEVFQVDIHPGAQFGRGVMLDHATGIVIGETAVLGDNVSMLHHVTLGGSGTGTGVRHPNIGHGVLLGAGVSVLGPVRVGEGAKVGAGSVVVADLPAYCVAVGVPARIVKRKEAAEPCKDMDQTTDFILDYII